MQNETFVCTFYFYRSVNNTFKKFKNFETIENNKYEI